MSEREDLAYIISAALGSVCRIYDTTAVEDEELADAILAAGYHREAQP